MDIIWTLLLTIILYFDIREKRIPDALTGAVFVCAVLQMIIFERPSMGEALAGAVVGGILFFFLLLWRPGAFGGGDVKLSIGNGMYLGVGAFIDSFVFAVFLAGIYVLTGILFKKIDRKSEIAFGPFLCIGALLARFAL